MHLPRKVNENHVVRPSPVFEPIDRGADLQGGRVSRQYRHVFFGKAANFRI